ncbi:Peptidase S41 family protein [Ceratobasidium theobromae]|uniref:Peptidase S41 family protein n=1 Tax=Ceratobasidium theobromae TaxID=1582974 RepID=A0A5N5QJR9_9AGAM|nr:Peptidase S41 family protein [Ceratobasidium theobromae]
MPYYYKSTTVDILGELQRIKATWYTSDFELHQDVSKTVKRLGDGHANYYNYCYDSLFVTYLPFPLAVLGSSTSDQTSDITIVPEAYEVISAEFGDQAIKIWESALNRSLSDFNGAKVTLINGMDPWTVVDYYAAVTGNFQAKSIRQNSFFSSYRLSKYRMGGFAQSAWPTREDSISLTLIRNGTATPETYQVPYLSRIGNATTPFTDAQSLWDNNCRATRFTNGAGPSSDSDSKVIVVPPTNPESSKERGDHLKHPDVEPEIVDGIPLAVSALTLDGRQEDPALPSRLFPTGEVSAAGSMYWFVLNDGKTAVLRLPTLQVLRQGVLDGITAVKSKGATRLLIDLTNNEGGTICLADWLHRVVCISFYSRSQSLTVTCYKLAGPQPGLDIQPGFNGSVRARDLPRKIVAKIVANSTQDISSWYNPRFLNDTQNKRFPANFNWLDSSIEMNVNGVQERFSQKIGDQCVPLATTPPDTKPFEFENIAIMSNGRCASACSLFSILMHTKYNVTTVVVGGKPQTTQWYCGFVGGQALNYVTLDDEIKKFGLKNDALSPPDFLTNSYLGALAYSSQQRELTRAG